MKKLLTLALALLMVLPVSLAAQAASSPVTMELGETLEDNGLAVPGKTYNIPIMNGGYHLHRDELEAYSFKVNLEVVSVSDPRDDSLVGTKRGASASLAVIGDYRYVRFSATTSIANRGNVTYQLSLESYDKISKEWTDPDIELIEVGFGANDYCSSSEYTVDNDTPLVEFSDSVSDCRIHFPDGSVFMASLVDNTKRNIDDGILRRVNLHTSTTPPVTLENKYSGYDFDYISFSSVTTFKEHSILRLYAPGRSYLYSVNGTDLTKLSFTKSGDFMVITTKTLGTYVMSSRELPASGSSSSSSTSGTSTATTPSTPIQGSALDTATAGSTADSAFSSGQSSVRFVGIGNVSVDAMQSVATRARTRGITPTVYFDTINSQGGVDTRIYVTPGNVTKSFSAAAGISGDEVSRVKNAFGGWFKNNLAVLNLGQAGEFGMTVSVASKLNLAGMNTSNLYLYSYNSAANTYSRINAPSTYIDSAGYLHFNTNIGDYIIVSDGALALR